MCILLMATPPVEEDSLVEQFLDECEEIAQEASQIDMDVSSEDTN